MNRMRLRDTVTQWSEKRVRAPGNCGTGKPSRMAGGTPGDATPGSPTLGVSHGTCQRCWQMSRLVSDCTERRRDVGR